MPLAPPREGEGVRRFVWDCQVSSVWLAVARARKASRRLLQMVSKREVRTGRVRGSAVVVSSVCRETRCRRAV